MDKMTGADYSAIQVTLAIDNPGLRRGLHDALKQWGFQAISEATTYSQVHELLRSSNPDLVLAVSEMDNFFVGHLVKEVRHANLGNHPFPVFILLLPSANPDYVKKVADCGPDDVLLMPVSTQQLLTRVSVLTRGRKPFVVTHDYVGPDRRKQTRDEAQVITPVEVPNPVGAKAGRMNAARLQRDIEAGARLLSNLKIERHAVQIQWLNDTIQNAFRSGKVEPRQMLTHTFGLSEIAKDLERRTKDWQNSQIPEYSAQLLTAAKALETAGASAGGRQLDNLTQVSGRIVTAIRRSLPSMGAIA